MFGGGGLFTVLTADMMSRVPQNQVSLVAGLISASQGVIYLISHPLIGNLTNGGVTFPTVLFTIVLWMVPGCIAWLLWKPPPKVALAAAARTH
jgi:hypothetical protein